MIELFLTLNPIVQAVLILVAALFALFAVRLAISVISIIAVLLADRFW